MALTLPKLPFSSDALEPHISAKTLDIHYGKHHNAYFTNLGNLIKGTELENETLENIIQKTSGVAEKIGMFNNAAQTYNHSFYWNSMKKRGGGKPPAEIGAMIDAAFGGYDRFKQEFENAATTQFGSGWAWLVLEGGSLRIIKTSNADTPIAHGQKPLLTIDVWEHAYYLDYQNRRPDYITAFIKDLLNWDFAVANLK